MFSTEPLPSAPTARAASPSRSVSRTTERPESQLIAQRLREARLVARKTQQELASGRFSKSYISAIERGKMTPSLQALDYLAEQLGVSKAYLVGEVELDQATLAEPLSQPQSALADQAQARKEAAAQLLLEEAEQADSATAVALLRAATYLSAQVRPLASMHLARLHLVQGESAAALALLAEGRAAAQATANVLAEGRVVLALAQLQEQQGNAAGAEQAYTEALTLLAGDPGQEEVRVHYSQFLAAAGRYEAAFHLLQAPTEPRDLT